MLTQYYTNIIGLMQQLGDPMLGMMVALKAITSGGEAMQQVLESFDLRNVHKLIITQQDIQRFSPQIGQFMQMMNVDPTMAGQMLQQQMMMQQQQLQMGQQMGQQGGMGNNGSQLTLGQGSGQGSSGLIQSPGMGIVNPVNTTVGGNY
jgi:hypothetical protein